MEILGADVQTLGKVLVGAVPAAATMIGLLRGPGAVRSRLKHDLELLQALPEGTEARTKFEEYLVGQVDRLSTYETKSSRNVSGLFVAGLVEVLCGAGAVRLFSVDHWWAWIAATALVVVLFAGAAVMFEYAQRVPRDDDGNPL